MGGYIMSKKIGLITFHNSYNCGSMMQTYALQFYINNFMDDLSCEVIDFSNEGQQTLYSVLPPNNNIKNFIKRLILIPHRTRIACNFESYEAFKDSFFPLSKDKFSRMEELNDNNYDIVITGSDQVWNITIEDGDDAYFLPWVKKARKVAYSPSFGSRSIQKNASNVKKYRDYLNDFDYLSIRENNGQKWIKELIDKTVPVLIDPTLLLNKECYDKIASEDLKLPSKYIFYYSPGYSRDINKLVQKISDKYSLPVIAFNSKTYYVKGMNYTKFKLPEIENPSTYLQLIKNAELIITTSFHGTIFSSIYGKKFWTIKNGGMYGEDDRVLTLMNKLDLEDRLIPIEFNKEFDYLKDKDYSYYSKLLIKEQEKAIDYLNCALY